MYVAFENQYGINKISECGEGEYMNLLDILIKKPAVLILTIFAQSNLLVSFLVMHIYIVHMKIYLKDLSRHVPLPLKGFMFDAYEYGF